MKLSVLLLLAACASTSIEDLQEELSVCLGGGYLCPELQEEIERRETREIERARWNALTDCPRGYIFQCVSDWCRKNRLGRKFPSKVDWVGSGCVRTADMERALSGW